MTLRTNAAGIALIKRFERLELRAYPDPASPRAVHARGSGVLDRDLSGEPWSIGWGHTRDVREGMTITTEEAERLFALDLAEAEEIVRRGVTGKVTANQFSALASFAFNVGPGRASRTGDKGKDGLLVLRSGNPSTLLRRVNDGDMLSAANEFLSWTRAQGIQLEGLKTRRLAERELFLTPDPPRGEYV